MFPAKEMEALQVQKVQNDSFYNSDHSVGLLKYI